MAVDHPVVFRSGFFAASLCFGSRGQPFARVAAWGAPGAGCGSVGPDPRERRFCSSDRRIGHVRPGFGGVLGGAIVSSSNWAGYDATGDDFESVQATWSQPYVQPDYSKDTDGCFWVGLDGDGGSQTVEQIGTEGYSQDGSVSYDAWYEMYPADSVQIEMTISPGDLMTGTVTANGRGDFT